MNDKGLDRLAAAAADITKLRVNAMYKKLESRGLESPIEKYFAIALYESCLIMSSGRFDDWNLIWPLVPYDKFDIPPTRIAIWAQQKVFGWRADFVLATRGVDDDLHFAIVECDGHDFHERTKEQAARDRARDRRVQQEGWRMFRFTGSELYQDAIEIACNEIIAGWALQKWGVTK